MFRTEYSEHSNTKKYFPINKMHRIYEILTKVHYKQKKIIHPLLTGAKQIPSVLKKHFAHLKISIKHNEKKFSIWSQTPSPKWRASDQKWCIRNMEQPTKKHGNRPIFSTDFGKIVYILADFWKQEHCRTRKFRNLEDGIRQKFLSYQHLYCLNGSVTLFQGLNHVFVPKSDQ